MIDVIVLTPNEPTPADFSTALDAVAAIRPELRGYQDPATGLLHLLESQTIIALTIEPTRHVQTTSEIQRLLRADVGTVEGHRLTWWTETHANSDALSQETQRLFTNALAEICDGPAVIA